MRELLALRAARVGAAYRQIVYRIDGGYETQPQIAWLRTTGRLFVAKGAIHRPAKWAARGPGPAWQPEA